MGEIAVGRNEEAIKTLLGSCIGLALYDRRGRVGGLAHIVLPESPGSSGPPGKFADTAVPELIRLIDHTAGAPGKLAAKLAGGACMFQTNAASNIGERNLESIERLLKNAGIPVVARHCGGDQGRRMTLETGSGRVRIEIVGRDPIEI
jgi:chemotaxis protein CheD